MPQACAELRLGHAWCRAVHDGGDAVKRAGDILVVGKNRQRAFWALIMIGSALAVSGWFLYIGLGPGRPGVGWVAALFGLMGLVAFSSYAAMILGTLRSPWNLTITPSHLSLSTETYDLRVPWAQVAGIAVDEVDRRLGCALVFDDVAEVARHSVFRRAPAGPEAVTNAARMQARMEDSFRQRGYHLGIPGRILELGPEALARLLAQARTGELWKESEARLEEVDA
jgi:hypothetical protein